MAKVQVLNVAVLDNPSPFGNPFQFEITFECMEDLPEGECGASGDTFDDLRRPVLGRTVALCAAARSWWRYQASGPAAECGPWLGCHYSRKVVTFFFWRWRVCACGPALRLCAHWLRGVRRRSLLDADWSVARLPAPAGNL